MGGGARPSFPPSFPPSFLLLLLLLPNERTKERTKERRGRERDGPQIPRGLARVSRGGLPHPHPHPSERERRERERGRGRGRGREESSSPFHRSEAGRKRDVGWDRTTITAAERQSGRIFITKRDPRDPRPTPPRDPASRTRHGGTPGDPTGHPNHPLRDPTHHAVRSVRKGSGRIRTLPTRVLRYQLVPIVQDHVQDRCTRQRHVHVQEPTRKHRKLAGLTDHVTRAQERKVDLVDPTLGRTHAGEVVHEHVLAERRVTVHQNQAAVGARVTTVQLGQEGVGIHGDPARTAELAKHERIHEKRRATHSGHRAPGDETERGGPIDVPRTRRSPRRDGGSDPTRLRRKRARTRRRARRAAAEGEAGKTAPIGAQGGTTSPRRAARIGRSKEPLQLRMVPRQGKAAGREAGSEERILLQQSAPQRAHRRPRAVGRLSLLRQAQPVAGTIHAGAGRRLHGPRTAGGEGGDAGGQAVRPLRGRIDREGRRAPPSHDGRPARVPVSQGQAAALLPAPGRKRGIGDRRRELVRLAHRSRHAHRARFRHVHARGRGGVQPGSALRAVRARSRRGGGPGVHHGGRDRLPDGRGEPDPERGVPPRDPALRARADPVPRRRGVAQHVRGVHAAAVGHVHGSAPGIRRVGGTSRASMVFGTDLWRVRRTHLPTVLPMRSCRFPVSCTVSLASCSMCDASPSPPWT
eukprot:scaffold826_cov335-Pavlova_lutheri.AAC.1